MKENFIVLLEKFIYPIFIATVFGVMYLLIFFSRMSGIDEGVFYLLVSFIFLGIFAGTFKEIQYRFFNISIPKYYSDSKFKTVIQVISGFIGILSYFALHLAYDEFIMLIVALIYWFALREIGVIIGYKIVYFISLIYGQLNNNHKEKCKNEIEPIK